MAALLSNIALIFPGQGSQSVGMARTIYDHNITKTAELADRIFGSKLTDVMFNGPAEKLNQTRYTQPAILTASVMILEYMRSFGEVDVICAAGHSIGEYSALVAAGVMSFETALSLVKIRADAMDEASPKNPERDTPLGAMSAILGGDVDILSEIINDLCSDDELLCSIANYNCPGQIVITGLREYVEQVCERAISNGAKKGVMLPVSGPFHSKWMQPAAERLTHALAAIRLEPPNFPVISNVTGQPTALEDVKKLLPRQVVAPVRWSDCMETMVKLGADTFIEIGSGNVLSGISKRCAPDKTFVSLQTTSDVEAFMSENV
ncbi:MAG: ACP S-malonyltransferase [Holosporales bacterium]|jgi:[acyl-carrier-protein] S-malonyltransferase|nr:ACP S-malonyltransferase [Holosporales bacterium]